MREQILEAAEKMVQDRGLNAVSFQDLATEVGLSKASVFHHFKNKEAIANALIDRCGTKHGPQYAAVVAKEISAPEKLKQIAKIFEAGLKNERPCLLAALGGSLNTLTPASVEGLRVAADNSINLFSQVFVQGRDEGTLTYDGKPIDAATAYFAMLQGLQVLIRAKGDLSAYRKAAMTYINSLSATP